MPVARPARDLERIRSFYEHVVGLPVLWSFVDHDGFDGVIFGVPDERAQLELVRSPHGDAPPRAARTPSCSTATARRPPPTLPVASNERPPSRSHRTTRH
jgi:catechol 2,3-dioxygenase-like lactoylglutathione lyase family enzyme